MSTDRTTQAVSLLQEGLSCSQAILLTYGPLFGLSRNDAVRISRGFGGGMARLSETCGAATGSFMVIGLKYSADDKTAKEDTYALIQKFAEIFNAEHGSLNCGLLTGCDLNTPEGWKYFKDNGILESHCARYVKHAAEIIEDLISLK